MRDRNRILIRLRIRKAVYGSVSALKWKAGSGSALKSCGSATPPPRQHVRTDQIWPPNEKFTLNSNQILSLSQRKLEGTNVQSVKPHSHYFWKCLILHFRTVLSNQAKHSKARNYFLVKWERSVKPRGRAAQCTGSQQALHRVTLQD